MGGSVWKLTVGDGQTEIAELNSSLQTAIVSLSFAWKNRDTGLPLFRLAIFQDQYVGHKPGIEARYISEPLNAYVPCLAHVVNCPTAANTDRLSRLWPVVEEPRGYLRDEQFDLTNRCIAIWPTTDSTHQAEIHLATSFLTVRFVHTFHLSTISRFVSLLVLPELHRTSDSSIIDRDRNARDLAPHGLNHSDERTTWPEMKRAPSGAFATYHTAVDT